MAVALTFAQKLAQMRRDLASIVDRMNRDQSFDKAEKAQAALRAVAELEDEDPTWFKELPWSWQPAQTDD